MTMRRSWSQSSNGWHWQTRLTRLTRVTVAATETRITAESRPEMKPSRQIHKDSYHKLKIVRIGMIQFACLYPFVH